jgi:hypothetical protein
VGFAVFRESFVNLRVRLEPGRLQARLDHAQAAEREDRQFEGLVSLQADNDLVTAVNVAGLVRQHGRRCLGINSKYASLLLVLEIGLQLGPDRLGAFRCRCQEFFVARISRYVANDEVAHIDAGAPGPLIEVPPKATVL